MERITQLSTLSTANPCPISFITRPCVGNSGARVRRHKKGRVPVENTVTLVGGFQQNFSRRIPRLPAKTACFERVHVGLFNAPTFNL